MILGYEEPVQMPTMDIYSTDLMKMYIEGVKDQYDKAEQEYDDFLKAYRDFYSLAPGANQEYYNLTLGAAGKLFNDLQKNGIDPYRSKEGQLAIHNFINRLPYGKIAQLKEEADAAKEYLKSVDELKSEGKFDPAFDAAIGGGNFWNWDRDKYGPWTRRNAIEYKTIGDMTSSFYDKLDKDEDLGPDEAMGKDAPFYHLYGVREGSLQIADEAALEHLKQTPYYNYYRQLASGYKDNEGRPIDPDVVLKQLSRAENSKYWQQPETKKYEKAFNDLSYQRQRSLARMSGGSGNGDSNRDNQYSDLNRTLNESMTGLFTHMGWDINSYDDQNSFLGGLLDAQTSLLKGAKPGNILNNFKIYQDNTGWIKSMGGYQPGQGVYIRESWIDGLRTDRELECDMRGSNQKITQEEQNVANERRKNIRNSTVKGSEGTHVAYFVPEDSVLGYVDKTNVYRMYVPGTMKYYVKNDDGESELRQKIVNVPIPQGSFSLEGFNFTSDNSAIKANTQMSQVVANKQDKIARPQQK